MGLMARAQTDKAATRDLTQAFLALLTEADPATFTVGDILAFLERHGSAEPHAAPGMVVLLPDEARPRPLFRPAAHTAALAALDALERAPFEAAAQTLDRVISRRQGLGDPWPEGCLNAGIAWALAGDLAAAQRRLKETIAILEGRGPSLDRASQRAA